jgi:hypothetical protein
MEDQLRRHLGKPRRLKPKFGDAQGIVSIAEPHHQREPAAPPVQI